MANVILTALEGDILAKHEVQEQIEAAFVGKTVVLTLCLSPLEGSSLSSLKIVLSADEARDLAAQMARIR
jgi:hypothetical protein